MDDRLYYEGAGSYDRETVRFFDAAHEGAQLRAVAQASSALEQLRGMRPRSVVVVGADQVALAAARAVAHLRAPLPLPVVVTSEVPDYVGPLDVVVVVGDTPDQLGTLRSLASAAGRGAETVLAGPASGPLVDDSPDATLSIPALPTTAGSSPLRSFGAVAAVLDALDQPGELLARRWETVADEIDQEVEALSPEREESVNAARQLRAFVAGARVVHAGFDACGLAVAQVASQVWTAHGIPAGFAGSDEFEAAMAEAPAAEDFFRDPFIDGDVGGGAPVRAVVWNYSGTVPAGSRGEACEPSDVGAEGTAARLIVRALCATVMDEPLS